MMVEMFEFPVSQGSVPWKWNLLEGSFPNVSDYIETYGRAYSFNLYQAVCSRVPNNATRIGFRVPGTKHTPGSEFSEQNQKLTPLYDYQFQ